MTWTILLQLCEIYQWNVYNVFCKLIYFIFFKFTVDVFRHYWLCGSVHHLFTVTCQGRAESWWMITCMDFEGLLVHIYTLSNSTDTHKHITIQLTYRHTHTGNHTKGLPHGNSSWRVQGLFPWAQNVAECLPIINSQGSTQVSHRRVAPEAGVTVRLTLIPVQPDERCCG